MKELSALSFQLKILVVAPGVLAVPQSRILWLAIASGAIRLIADR